MQLNAQLDNPLSDKEFDELDRFLMSSAVSDEGMTMDALHGYLTAIAIGPEAVPLSEWLPNVWGPSVEDAPKFSSEKQEQHIINLIARYMHEIQTTFEVAPKEFEPLFCVYSSNGQEVLDGETWAWGFWEGMQLRAKAWEAVQSSPLAPLLRPIYLLGANEISEEEMKLVDDPRKCHKLALEIEAAIPHLHQYWQAKRVADANSFKPELAQQSADDICNCGSGKKYKNCCGAGPTVH